MPFPHLVNRKSLGNYNKLDQTIPYSMTISTRFDRDNAYISYPIHKGKAHFGQL